MRDIMYDIPSNPKIEKCTITKETVTDKKGPELVINDNKGIENIKIKKEREYPNSTKVIA